MERVLVLVELGAPSFSGLATIYLGLKRSVRSKYIVKGLGFAPP